MSGPVFVTTTAVSVSVLFTRLSPKSKDVVLNEAEVDGAATCKDTVALCESPEPVPATAMLVVPGVAFGDAVMVIWPSVLVDVRERVVGDAVTPEGRDPIVTATAALKPLVGEIATFNVCEAPPGVTLTVEGATSREKSPLLVLLLLLPHPTHATKYRSALPTSTCCFMKTPFLRKLPETNDPRTINDELWASLTLIESPLFFRGELYLAGASDTNNFSQLCFL